MCLINFHIHDHPNYKLIVAANRDEFYKRPTAPAQFWKDDPQILAGRDLLQMGTWLGITKQGRFAALTNFRDPSSLNETGKISRGAIVKDFLATDISPQDFLESIKEDKDNYAGFNVLVGNADRLFHYNNTLNEVSEVPVGTHGLSNHSLNTPWPKVTKGKKMLNEYVTNHDKVQTEKLFEIVSDAEEARDEDLPQTGVGIELERKLSSLFIKTPEYGTRCSTVLLIDKENHITFSERTYQKGEFLKESNFTFQVG